MTTMPPQMGFRLWQELHSFAWNYPEQASASMQQLARDWLAAFARRVRLAGPSCPCSDEWTLMVTNCPPDLTSRNAFYWWTVAAHDRINAKLDKPLASEAWSRAHPIFDIPF